MSVKNNLFGLCLIMIAAAGCNLLADRQAPPKVGTVPPYWQSQSELEQLRAFHNSESDKMNRTSENVHVVRNREMERLEAAGKELEKEKLWQEDYEKTIARREKWFGWMGKNEEKTSALSSKPEDKNVR